MERNREIYKVTLVGGAVNVLLLVFKFVAGILGHSAAMVADAVHSLSDFITDVIVLVFVHISSKPKDKSHDYGHGKYETLAMTIIGIALLAAAIGIIYGGALKIADWLGGQRLEAPGMLALWAALLSVVLGIGGAIFLGQRWTVLDPLASVIVGAFIVKVAIELLARGIGDLLEQSLPDEIETEILQLAATVPGISEPHDLRTRRIGDHYAIELHILVDGDIPLREAHDRASEVEQLLRNHYGDDTHVVVHVEPKQA